MPSNKSQALQNHLAWCRSCQKLYREWQEILKDSISVEPSSFLYKRLTNSFLRWQIRCKLLSPATLWGMASVAVIAMFILAITAIKSNEPIKSWEQLPVALEDIPSFVMDDAKTVQYQVEPRNGQLSSVSGIIWVNGHRDEVFCYVQNLKNNADHDYQIWLVKPVKKENGGLLRVMDGYGHLYLQQRNILEVRQISLSLEPKGGSSFPTTEDIVLVDFNFK